MIYDREEILNMLSNAPLYEGDIFHEGKNDDFIESMDNTFNDNYYYMYGASKFVIIPKDKKKDYVIKIPYTGSYYNNLSEDEGYIENDEEEYIEYYGAEDSKNFWDYCECEVNRYKITKKVGLSSCFAKTELLGYINNYPIYIQEKCITFKSCKHNHKHTKKEKSITVSTYDGHCNINKNLLTDFRLYYGETKLLKFINFIRDFGWDDDLRNDNIGYIGNRPVLIDYSGFSE
jgi:hypothetical protein